MRRHLRAEPGEQIAVDQRDLAAFQALEDVTCREQVLGVADHQDEGGERERFGLTHQPPLPIPPLDPAAQTNQVTAEKSEGVTRRRVIALINVERPEFLTHRWSREQASAASLRLILPPDGKPLHPDSVAFTPVRMHVAGALKRSFCGTL